MAKFIVQLRRATKEEWETIGKDIIPLDGELVLEDPNSDEPGWTFVYA